MDFFDRIHELKVVPVVVLNSVDEVEMKIGGLIEGQLPVAEITFRTACAAEAIRKAVELYPEALIGAGTVIDRKQCEEAIDSGAKFIVSPGLVEEVSLCCREKHIPYLPGVVTPTEIIKAMRLGHHVVKFFPASSFGGLKTVKSLASVFPNLRFLPTGGIDQTTYKAYLAFDRIVAVGGSWMMKGSHEEIVEKSLAIHKGL